MSTIVPLYYPTLEEMEAEEEQGRLSRREHPELPLWVWNYTQQVQFDYDWNETTSRARGLITDHDGNVVGACMHKFYNAHDHDEKWYKDKEILEITEKVDGSLISVFNYEGQWLCASRGSFESDQAGWAQEILDDWPVGKLHEDYTYVCELVHPKNRIVVDYDGKRDLVLLTAIKETEEFHHEVVSTRYIPWTGTKATVHSEAFITKILETNPDNFEGVVVRYKDGSRVKVKTPKYVELHRIVTNLTPKNFTQAWIDGKHHEIIESVPDEWHDNLKKNYTLLRSYKKKRAEELEDKFNEIFDPDQTRKDFALKAKELGKDTPYMFCLLDNDMTKFIDRLNKEILQEHEDIGVTF